MSNDWIYRNVYLTTIPDGYVGFVYLIYRMGDDDRPKRYIGKKLFYTKSTVKRKTGQNAIQLNESDWLSYYGSSKELCDDIVKYGINKFIRVILHLCTSKEEMTYLEVSEQFDRNVLHVCENGYKEYYNGNILGKFYKSHRRDEILSKISSYRDMEGVCGNNKGKVWINNGKSNKIVTKTEANRMINNGNGWLCGKISKIVCYTNGIDNIYTTDKNFTKDGYSLGKCTHKVTNGINNKSIPVEDIEQFLKDNDGWRVGFCGNDGLIWINNKIDELKINKDDIHLYIGYEPGRLRSPLLNKVVVSKDNDIKYIENAKLSLYEKDGWVLGNDKLKNKKVMTKDGDTIKVNSVDVPLYEKDGWVLGFSDKTKTKLHGRKSPTKDRISIHKGGQKKYILPDELSLYEGWIIGTGQASMKGKIHSDSTKELYSIQRQGSKNSMAIVIYIYDKNNTLRYKCNGNFKSVCMDNNLPFSILKTTYQNETVISNSRKYKKFNGWYARKIVT